MTDDFPIPCKVFLAANIKSVADLEVVLLLREHRDRSWTALEVSRTLSTNNEMASMQLHRLVDQGLVVVHTESPCESFQYEPASQAEVIIEVLATLYKERPVRLIAEIYSKPIDNARTFADSFRLRKEK